MKKSVSIILACYNDALSVRECTGRIINILDATKYRYELILIDDASKDSSREEIELTKTLYPDKNIRAYFHNKNVGRGGTVREGLLKAKGEIVGFLDIDLEVSENYLPAFIRAIESGADIAIGSRVYKVQPHAFSRHLGSVIYRFLVKKMLGLPFQDTEAGYKFFNRLRTLNILKQTKDDGWFWDTEIVAQAFYAGLKIVEVPVLFIRRTDKKSTVRLIRDSWLHLQSLVKFKKEYGGH